MNCLDCVSLLHRKKQDGSEDYICMLDNRVAIGIIECNRFKAIEISIGLTETFSSDYTGDKPTFVIEEGENKPQPEIIDLGYGAVHPENNAKHRGWPKGKKRVT